MCCLELLKTIIYQIIYLKIKCVKLFTFHLRPIIMISRRVGDEKSRTSDMSKLRMPFTFGHLVLSSRLFQTPPEASTRRPTSSAIVTQQNPKRRLVLRCIFAMHSDPVHEHARTSKLRSRHGLFSTVETTKGHVRTYVRAHEEWMRLMTITIRTKRGWPLSRSSLCILAALSFSIGNLFHA